MEIRQQGNLGEVARLFLKLGVIAFGGPAAHIAMMHAEVVQRRQWVTEQEFLDLLGATNLIPGPNSTEMAIHLGFKRAGWRGLITAGTCFIVPAMLIVLAFAWAYVRFGSTPQAAWLLYGITPVIIAVVFQALWTLARRAVKDVSLGVLGSLVFVLYLGGLSEIPLMLGVGVLAMLLTNVPRLLGRLAILIPLPLAARAPSVPLSALAVPSGLLMLFLVFLKVGAVLYGSGYVLLAFLQRDLVTRLGWLVISSSSTWWRWDSSRQGRSLPPPPLSALSLVADGARSWRPWVSFCPRLCS